MNYAGRLIFILFLVWAVSACGEKRTAADTGDDMYVVSNGMLAVDTGTASSIGIYILDRAGQKMAGVVPLRNGFSISQDKGRLAVIESSPDALTILDSNNDNQIDAEDPAWKNMHLAVDYDGDGKIGDGEYALIGECGVDALKIDVSSGEAWSVHSDGKTKVVKLPTVT